MRSEPEKTFKRLSMKERGHFSNCFSLSPVKEIKVSDNDITLQTRFNTYNYKWTDITEAKLVHSYIAKGYGRAWATMKTKLVILKTRDRTFKFDLSNQFPDFKEKDQLLAELTKHLNMEEEKIIPAWKKYDKLMIWLFVPGLLVAFIGKRYRMDHDTGYLVVLGLLVLAPLLFSCLKFQDSSKRKIR